jgi:ferredoxin-NADP reductase/predicted pyridoxine 5'-phosphate oxidase superfamily flavin-nucleotide-binding protein
MARSFADIAFTPAVRDFQGRMGSRRNYAALDDLPPGGATLGEREAEFIAARDGFYQASVGEGGWPYVQFRGGPAGFLRVLDERTLGYADFRGNVQYISAGNIASDGRVSLILMDYAERRRLKIWGRARLVDAAADPALLARLEVPSYRARVERAVVIDVEAFDWNCPQHITPRFTEEEIAARIAPLQAEIDRLRATPAGASSASTAPAALGRGALSLVVRAVRQLTPDVRAFELAAVDGGALPPAAPGSHLDVPVRLANGIESTRRYSVMPVTGRADAWEIAVQREAKGTGGSAAVHRDFAVGLRLDVAPPGNDFPLHDDERPAVLVAGGIGITPLRAMARALAARGRDFVLHYAGRTPDAMPYLGELSASLGERLRAYPGDRGARMDLDAVFAQAAAGSLFYLCGPSRLIDAALEAGARHGVAPDRIRFERFAAAPRRDDAAVEVVLGRSGKTIRVAPAQSILDALTQAGVPVPSGCRTGTCGTCATKVLAGTPDHRDTALSAAERERAGLMCVCVSRATTPALTLDL